MKKLFLHLLFFMSISLVWSQDFSKEYFFKKNSYSLSDNQIQDLTSRLGAYEDLSRLKLKIAGYSDNTGGLKTNLDISKNRAEEVKKIALKLGVPDSNISVNYFGVLRPAYTNSTEKGRAKNRRVFISASYIALETVMEEVAAQPEEVVEPIAVIEETPKKKKSKTEKQNFSFSLNDSKTIVAENGTKVTIEPDAFNIPADLRNAHPNDQVNIEVVEYYDKSDFVLNDLSTQLADGTIIESGGMLDVKASYAGVPVDLRPNRSMALEFPTDNYQEGMRDWYGKEDKDGNVVWNENPYDLKGREKKDPNKKKKLKKILLITAGVLAAAAATYAIARASGAGSGSSGGSSSNNSISNSAFDNTTSSSSDESPYRNSSSGGETTTAQQERTVQNSTSSNSNSSQNIDRSRFQILSRGTGRINCDRLITPNVTTSFRLMNPNPNAKVKMVFKDRNIVLVGKQNKNGKVVFRGLPLNEKVYIVATEKKGDMTEFCMFESNTNNWRRIKPLNYETIQNNNLKGRLACLDR